MAQRLLYLRLVKNPREMLAAGLGGVAGTVLDVVMLVLLVELGTYKPFAAFLASVMGAAVCFWMNKRIAFDDRTPVTAEQVIRFGFVAVVNAVLMAVAMKIMAVDLGFHYVGAKLIGAAAIFVAWTYPAQRRLVFRRPAHAM